MKTKKYSGVLLHKTICIVSHFGNLGEWKTEQKRLRTPALPAIITELLLCWWSYDSLVFNFSY